MEQFSQLFQGVMEFKWQFLIMYAIGTVLILFMVI